MGLFYAASKKCKSTKSKDIFWIKKKTYKFANPKREILQKMKKDIHPKNYRLVAFKDMSNDFTFICRSTAPAKDTITIDGVEYPLVKLEISSTSHPFYTGKMKLVDTAGRVDKFMNRYKQHYDKKAKK